MRPRRACLLLLLLALAQLLAVASAGGADEGEPSGLRAGERRARRRGRGRPRDPCVPSAAPPGPTPAPTRWNWEGGCGCPAWRRSGGSSAVEGTRLRSLLGSKRPAAGAWHGEGAEGLLRGWLLRLSSAQVFLGPGLPGRGVGELLRVSGRTRPGSAGGEGGHCSSNGIPRRPGREGARGSPEQPRAASVLLFKKMPVDLEIRNPRVLVGGRNGWLGLHFINTGNPSPRASIYSAPTVCQPQRRVPGVQDEAPSLARTLDGY